MDRRRFLKGLACSAAAHPLLTTVTLAGSSPALGENRLVVIILRGAMDGLDVVQPRGEAVFAALRPGLSAAPALPLDDFFHLHAGLGGLLPLWRAGELAFVHATSTPYRDKRSHFDGQDMLEAGTGMDVAPAALRDGWLNRMLQAVPGTAAETAYAVGRDEMKVLMGPAPVREWAPDQGLPLSAQGRRLLERICHDDPLFGAAVADALDLTQRDAPRRDAAGTAETATPVEAVADFAAARLMEDARIAAFSLNGWDTHRGQNEALGRPLKALEQAILRLKLRLSPEVWARTAVLAMTEFGRTVAENGSRGTDHGTGGAMVAAGGAIRGGRVFGRWPGLDEAALYDRRDLMPTSDVRAWAAGVMRGFYGFGDATLEDAVFPGLDLGGAGGGAGL
ncbi:MAG: DUF1501 domain-containing protein, partial [Rhodobacteraceae bacterium]|nr:DUF1501 domain-containing protein [Paracoccaceae bacterium]